MSRPLRVLQVVPTVTGREAHLERWHSSHNEAWAEAVQRRGSPAVVISTMVVHDKPTCAHAWNEAGERARDEGFDVLYCSADDLEPSSLAFVGALDSIEQGVCPSPLIYHAASGQVESHGLRWGHMGLNGEPDTMTRIPFLRSSWWPPQGIPEIHYWSDNCVSDWLQFIRVPILLSTEFSFKHHWAVEGRHDGADDRAQAERAEWVRWRTALATTAQTNADLAEWKP